MTLLVFKYFLSRAMKAEGAAAVARENSVRWHRKPESMIICSLWFGFANFTRNILEDRSYMLDTRRVTRVFESSCAMTCSG